MNFDYQRYHQIMDTARRHHSATPIYGIDPSRPDNEVRGFDSEIKAVVAAANIYNPFSIDRDKEYIGAVLKRNGYFYYTVGEGHRGEDAVEVHLYIPASYSIVAFWHTHGAPAYKRMFFSETDKRLVKLYGKPFYLADYTGSLRVLLPEQDTLRRVAGPGSSSRHKTGFLRGKLVQSEAGKMLNVCTVRNA